MLVAPPWYSVPPCGYGGIELVVALLAGELSRRGHDVTLVASGSSCPEVDVRSPLAEPPDPSMVGNPAYEAYHALAAYTDVTDVDVVHDHSGVVGPALASRDPSLPPVVHTLHGPWTPEGRHLYRLVDRRVHLVAISNAQRDDNCDVQYAATIHNGIDTDAYPLGPERRGDDLIFIGRANPDKNPDGAIRIARATGRPLTLLVKRHEPDEHEYWDANVAPLLGSDIQVCENVGHDAKVQLLQGAYAMVFPIRWPEPFGLVMVEAMACGTPVIATPCGAAPEVIADGRTGYLCDSEPAMARAIDQVDALDRVACRQRVIDHFSSPSMARRYEALFARVTLGPGDAACSPRPDIERAGSHRPTDG
jgi:glycosyltransferase involved in cell wall biosynthesis